METWNLINIRTIKDKTNRRINKWIVNNAIGLENSSENFLNERDTFICNLTCWPRQIDWMIVNSQKIFTPQHNYMTSNNYNLQLLPVVRKEFVLSFPTLTQYCCRSDTFWSSHKKVNFEWNKTRIKRKEYHTNELCNLQIQHIRKRFERWAQKVIAHHNGKMCTRWLFAIHKM